MQYENFLFLFRHRGKEVRFGEKSENFFMNFFSSFSTSRKSQPLTLHHCGNEVRFFNNFQRILPPLHYRGWICCLDKRKTKNFSKKFSPSIQAEKVNPGFHLHRRNVNPSSSHLDRTCFLAEEKTKKQPSHRKTVKGLLVS